MKPVPETLRNRPFGHHEAYSVGVSERMLRGRRFTSVHPRVWRCADHVMTEADDAEAARIALPPDAQVTGITRLRMEGLEMGERTPVHFVVARDHHIALPGIFLHRTKKLPPTDDKGVTIEAAYLCYCRTARLIDAIKAGDWLLRETTMTVDSLLELALAEPWRDGADEARFVANYLDARSRSLAESETRALIAMAGLPVPEPNEELVLPSGRAVVGDLVYRDLGLVVEYEGVHHQEDRRQYGKDIDRYADMRACGLDYLQVTKEKLGRPRRLVDELHRRMAARGYTGPAPRYDGLWPLLFLPVTVAVADRFRRFGRRSGEGQR
jgi:hypothetical protein